MRIGVPLASKSGEGWSPYGLEAIRQAHLRRRRFLSILLALGLVGLWFVMFQTTTTTETQIFANGQRAGSGIQIGVPETEPPKNGPVTVSLAPGRVTRADTDQQGIGGESIQRPNSVTIDRPVGHNWNVYIMLYGPFALLGAAIYFLGKRGGKSQDEVNFGVYKGALPLELLTASARHHVVTRRFARESIFGKRRGDYLPRGGRAIVERVAQEDDA